MKTTVYEIWLVENGSLTDFGRGLTPRFSGRANLHWDNCYSIDEVKQRIRAYADEEFRRDGGEYDRIWDECAAAHPEEEPEGFSEPERKCSEFCDACADAFGFEWQDDLKWVRVREMVEDDDGNRTFVKVLP